MLDPEQRGGKLADSVGLAMLVVLDTLTPPERLAFVLHDVFAIPFDEIASIVDRTPEATRQLASRARRRVQGATPRTNPDMRAQRRLIDAFPCRLSRPVTSTRWSQRSTRTSSFGSISAELASQAD